MGKWFLNSSTSYLVLENLRRYELANGVGCVYIIYPPDRVFHRAPVHVAHCCHVGPPLPRRLLMIKSGQVNPFHPGCKTAFC